MCICCCCKVPGIIRGWSDYGNEEDDEESVNEAYERKRGKHRRKKKHRKQRAPESMRQSSRAWWKESAAQMSQTFGGENPMAKMRKTKQEPAPARAAKSKPKPPPPPETLPEGWEEYFDDEQQRPYFYNEETGETVWERPTDMAV